MNGTAEEQADRLARVEAKLDELLAKVEKFELAAAGFMGGPMVAKLFAGIRGPSRDG